MRLDPLRNGGLPGALALAAAVLAGCDVRGPEPNVSLERMIDQPRYDAYAEATFFADGKVMRTPPAGTVPRERPAGAPLLLRGRSGDEFAADIPLGVDEALLARGRERFEIYCAACHGERGEAETPVARFMTLRAPPSLHLERIRGLPPGRVFDVITTGYGLMPSYAPMLSVEERWAVVAWVGVLQLGHALPLDELPEELRRRAEQELAP